MRQQQRCREEIMGSGAEGYYCKCQGVAKGENSCGVSHLTSEGRFGRGIDIILHWNDRISKRATLCQDQEDNVPCDYTLPQRDRRRVSLPSPFPFAWCHSV